MQPLASGHLQAPAKRTRILPALCFELNIVPQQPDSFNPFNRLNILTQQKNTKKNNDIPRHPKIPRTKADRFLAFCRVQVLVNWTVDAEGGWGRWDGGGAESGAGSRHTPPPGAASSDGIPRGGGGGAQWCPLG